MSYSENKLMLKKKKKVGEHLEKKGGIIGSCPHVPVIICTNKRIITKIKPYI
jgi:hypothetical protein